MHRREHAVGDFLCAVADDKDQFCAVAAVEHLVEHIACDDHGKRGIDGDLKIVEDDKGQRDDGGIDDQRHAAGADGAVFLPQKLDHDVRAARAAARTEDQSETEPVQRRTAERDDRHIVGHRRNLRGIGREQIHDQRGERRGVDGEEDKLLAEAEQRQNQQRNVHHKDQRTGRNLGHMADDDRETGDAAGRQLCRVIKKGDGNGENQRTERGKRNPLENTLETFLFHKRPRV